MDLEYQDLNNKSGYSFEELLQSVGIDKPNKGEQR